MALSGDILVIESTDNAGEWLGQWLTRDGTLIGTTFPLSGQRYPVARFLLDGSVLVGFWDVFPYDVQWMHQVQDGVSAPAPAPKWVTDRPGSAFWPIRGGKATRSQPPSDVEWARWKS